MIVFQFLSLVLSRLSFLKLSTIFTPVVTDFVAKSQAMEFALERDAKEVRAKVAHLMREDPSKAGSIIRLAFHDSITTSKSSRGSGPNGSIQFELDRLENRGLQTPLQFVLSELWHETNFSSLSLADVIALAGSEAVFQVGGPFIPIKLGRPDATTSDPEFLPSSDSTLNKWSQEAQLLKTLPSASLNADGLRQYFCTHRRFSELEFVALSGVHGLGRHISLLGMSKSCLKQLTRQCLEDAPVKLPFVSPSVDHFDNSYFEYLLKWYAQDIQMGEVAFIPTDVALVVDVGLRKHVQYLANNPEIYARIFATAYQKLVETTATTKRRY
mmetsp:Transcript_20154/g.30304  ORF Transcript_20154/g.30304 Transcript_20154/m.30304 type:complete len:327 (-) Transcript_20154:1490-2470(-)|eukprot:CAMPEP_0178938280 /NCGR_PEP_ID=MMETSP0786-20121207/26243_1 /TAXON_ID=186022 /ORGANISM="Thalassionema frauenfeldii, Strain CCMP 1798" /LENGTH=326 /DNA_ID=CAMNT_0020616981 /DNA_START=57 /DNA_END=1037 /DNA_ORIENTATION=+